MLVQRPTDALSRPLKAAILLATAGTWLASCAALAGPQKANKRGRDTIDPEHAAAVASYVTDPAYLTDWVDHLPVSKRVPDPKAFLGYHVGTPGKLTAPETINAYFRELAAKSKRVEVRSMGKSHGGREMLVAFVGSKKNLKRIDEIAAANHELADPRNTDEAKARKLADDTPPMFWMTAGLHSPETGPPEMVMELAYRLAVSEQDHIREIRDNVVVMITPVLEMDGRARMVDWYERHLTGVTDLEDSPPRMAPYWGDYTAHDNNRDGLQLSQPLTQNYVETFHRYLPVATLDLHESVPLLYVSTGTGPYNESVDPITVTEWQLFASYEVSQATKMGLQGVWTWGFYTGWYPGYLLWVSTNHHGVGRFYETFGNSNPGTFERDLSRSSFSDARTNSRQWYRAWPPPKKLDWSLRNNTNYMQTGVLASLQLAARHRRDLLFNFWQKHTNTLQKGQSEAPYAFWIPAKQRDKGATHRLLELLARHRIEVHRLEADTKLGEHDMHAGDFVVRMDQPYGNFARTLLLAQPFPKTATSTPYDDVAWSLDYMLGLDITPVDIAKVQSLAMAPLAPDATDALAAVQGGAGQGERFVVDHAGQATLASLVWALPNHRVHALREAWKGHPAGSLIIEGPRDAADQAAKRLRLDLAPVQAPPASQLVEVDRPRVALFHTWRYTQDSGWLRFTLEQYGIPYTLIDKDDLRAGKLAERFDVILLPSQGGLDFSGIVHGIDPKHGPLAYTQAEGFESHGVIDSSPDITGGMGFEGLAALQRFAEGGGVLVGLGSGGLLLSDSGMARGVRGRNPGGSPGSHITTKVARTEHPLAWGYPVVDWVFRQNLPVFDVSERDRGQVIVQFGTQTFAEAEKARDAKADVASPRASVELPTEPAPADATKGAKTEPAAASDAAKAPLVRSGILKKPDTVQRKPALLDVPIGKGRALLFSWNPAHRFQNHHDLGYLANALLFFNDMPAPISRDEAHAREEAAATPPKAKAGGAG